ncbi:MAG TPA: hypothetical protein VGH27_07735 [Streptosporangiaceae bacterium]|jgi:hypothetical protein
MLLLAVCVRHATRTRTTPIIDILLFRKRSFTTVSLLGFLFSIPLSALAASMTATYRGLTPEQIGGSVGAAVLGR